MNTTTRLLALGTAMALLTTSASAGRVFMIKGLLSIPTPRWTAYEAMRYGIEMPDYVAMATQERAYTLPIWYTP